MNKETTITRNYKWVWGVITQTNVTMITFDRMLKAVNFRNNGYGGYYKSCYVQLIQIATYK